MNWPYTKTFPYFIEGFYLFNLARLSPSFWDQARTGLSSAVSELFFETIM